jgi:hypothetical protein
VEIFWSQVVEDIPLKVSVERSSLTSLSSSRHHLCRSLGEGGVMSTDSLVNPKVCGVVL